MSSSSQFLTPLDPTDVRRLSAEEIKVKVVVIGAPRIGKTTLCRRYFWDVYTAPDEQSTMARDYYRKTCYTMGKTIALEGNDVPGQQNFREMTCNFFRGAHAIVLVTSLDDPTTWDDALLWLDRARELEPCLTGSDPAANMKVPVILAANMCDKANHCRNEQEISAFADRIHASHWCMTSGRANTNVAELFNAAIATGVRAQAAAKESRSQLRIAEVANGGGEAGRTTQPKVVLFQGGRGGKKGDKDSGEKCKC